MKKQEDIATGLTVKGSAEFGKALLEQAQEANRKALQEKITAEVQKVLQNIRSQESMRDGCERNIRVLRERVDAISKGQFTIDHDGNLTLTDEKLAPLGLSR